MLIAEPLYRGNNSRLPNRDRWPLHDAWDDRVWQEFAAGNLTRCDRDVLLRLPTFRGPDGEIFPSQAAIAKRAGCSERTARRALAMGGRLSLVVAWQRGKKTNGRRVRTSNGYLLNVPETPIKPGLRPPWPKQTWQASTGQFGRVKAVSKKEAHEGMVRAAAGMPDLLAAQRQSFLEKQLAARR
jgi:hypothetical protein